MAWMEMSFGAVSVALRVRVPSLGGFASGLVVANTGSVLPAGCCRAFGIGGCQGRCGLVACGQNTGESARLQGTALFRIARAGEVEPDLPDESGRARKLAEPGQLGFAHAPVGDPPGVCAQGHSDVRASARAARSCSYSVGSTVHESAPMPGLRPLSRYGGRCGCKSHMAVHIVEFFHEQQHTTAEGVAAKSMKTWEGSAALSARRMAAVRFGLACRGAVGPRRPGRTPRRVRARQAAVSYGSRAARRFCGHAVASG